MDTDGASVSALISVPARTVVVSTVTFLPLRLSVICGAAAPLPPPPPRGAGAPGAGAAPGAPPLGAPAPRAPAPPPALIPMRPKSPLHTAAFQVGSVLHALSSLAIPL